MTRPALTVICPTRGRPANFYRMVASVLEKAADPTRLEILGYVDEDDADGPLYMRMRKQFGLEDIVTIFRGPSLRPVAATNILADKAAADWVFAFCDDAVMHTKGWDDKMLAAGNAVPDKLAVVYTKQRGGEKWVHYMVHKRWIEVLGYICFPGFFHYASDSWIWEVASRVGRTVTVPDVEAEHLHFLMDKAPKDETYARNQVVANYDLGMQLRIKRYMDTDVALLKSVIKDG